MPPAPQARRLDVAPGRPNPRRRGARGILHHALDARPPPLPSQQSIDIGATAPQLESRIQAGVDAERRRDGSSRAVAGRTGREAVESGPGHGPYRAAHEIADAVILQVEYDVVVPGEK